MIRLLRLARRLAGFSLLLAVVLGWQPLLAAELSSTDLAAAISAAARVEPGGDRSPFRSIEQQVRAAIDNPKLRSGLEQGLLSLLGSESTSEAKAFACKHLAFIGTEKSAPALAALLDVEALSSTATSALAAMRNAKADEALRAALPRLTGKNQLQVVNALGDRRDPKAIAAIAGLIKGADSENAATALAALGKIGTSEAHKALARESKKVPEELKPAVDQSLLACARALAGSGRKQEAESIYTGLIGPGKTPAIRRGAFSGLLAAEGDASVRRAVETLRQGDPVLTPVATEAVRQMPGRDVAKVFIQELPKLPVRDQAALLDSIADRSEPEARAFVANALTSAAPEMRMAAVHALARTGGAGEVPVLSKALETGLVPEEQRALESALASLQGGGATDAAIQAATRNAPREARPSLLKALGARKGPAANQVLLEHAAAGDNEAALAALRVLEKTAGAKEAPELLKVVRTTRDPKVRAAAGAASAHALSQASLNPRFSFVQSELSASKDNPEAQAVLISLLPMCATTEALALLLEVAKSKEAEVREAASEALTDWPSIEAWDALLEMNKSSSAAVKNGAFRALVRLAGEANTKQDSHLMTRYEQLLARASSPADHKLILGALGGAVHPRALEMALQQLDMAAVRAEAEVAIRKIAGALKASHPAVAAAALEKLPAK